MSDICYSKLIHEFRYKSRRVSVEPLGVYLVISDLGEFSTSATPRSLKNIATTSACVIVFKPL
jgi:hypothetical protein